MYISNGDIRRRKRGRERERCRGDNLRMTHQRQKEGLFVLTTLLDFFALSPSNVRIHVYLSNLKCGKSAGRVQLKQTNLERKRNPKRTAGEVNSDEYGKAKRVTRKRQGEKYVNI